MTRPLLSLGAATLLAAFLTAAFLAVGCGAPRPLDRGDPQAVALHLFEMARDPSLADGPQLALLTAGELDDVLRAALGDALNDLELQTLPRVIGVGELLEKRVAVDLEAELPGGGTAYYSVHCRADADGLWRVTWFSGPGVEWPERSVRGQGLTSSAAPE